jgi:hypothetical protein
VSVLAGHVGIGVWVGVRVGVCVGVSLGEGATVRVKVGVDVCGAVVRVGVDVEVGSSPGVRDGVALGPSATAVRLAVGGTTVRVKVADGATVEVRVAVGAGTVGVTVAAGAEVAVPVGAVVADGRSVAVALTRASPRAVVREGEGAEAPRDVSVPGPAAARSADPAVGVDWGTAVAGSGVGVGASAAAVGVSAGAVALGCTVVEAPGVAEDATPVALAAVGDADEPPQAHSASAASAVRMAWRAVVPLLPARHRTGRAGRRCAGSHAGITRAVSA